MRQPNLDLNIFKERRRRLAEKAPGSALILSSHPEHIRNNDVHHPYRQDTNFYYLTGFEEPESVFIFRPGQSPETVMFVREKNMERETWDGFRYGVDATAKLFAIDKTYPIADFELLAPDLLSSVDRVYTNRFMDPHFDKQMESILKATKAKSRRSGKGLLPVFDICSLLGELRVFKSAVEAAQLRKACEITAEAHIEVMKQTRPGLNEKYLHGVFIKEIYARGAAREGYGGIFAGGFNATTLHYVFNDQTLRDGDLFLVDAGAEYQYFTGDITRTFPVNGKFNSTQKRIYQGVLDVQKSLIDMVKPGISLSFLQEATISGLVDLMLDEKLLKGNKSDLIHERAFLKYYPHGVSHYLGMDVHDAGLAEINGKPRLIEAGMAFTIEPGIYIPLLDESAPEELRGLGVRIEDDILVTDSGCEVLTEKAVKEVSDIEAIMG